MMIDIFFRYIVGAEIHAAESAVLAADRGTSMTSKTVPALLSGRQRQPPLRGVVQDREVGPDVPEMLRQLFDVHCSLVVGTAIERSAGLAAARAANPE